MEKIRKYAPRIMVVVLVIALIFAFVKISELETTLRNIEIKYQNRLSSMSDEIGDIYSNVDEKLKKQASLFSDIKWQFDEFDVNTNTVEIEFLLVPKTITEGMNVSVNIGNNTVTLTKSGNSFCGTLAVDMFIEETSYPLVNIKIGETVQTELLDNVDLSCLFRHYLPAFSAHKTFDNNTDNNEKLSLNFDYFVDFYPTEYSSVENFFIVCELNGMEVERQDITSQVKQSHEYNSGTYNSTFTYTADTSEGDEFIVYAVGEDSLGYIHKIPVSYWMESSENVEYVDKAAQIFSPDGVLLFDPAY